MVRVFHRAVSWGKPTKQALILTRSIGSILTAKLVSVPVVTNMAWINERKRYTRAFVHDSTEHHPCVEQYFTNPSRDHIHRQSVKTNAFSHADTHWAYWVCWMPDGTIGKMSIDWQRFMKATRGFQHFNGGSHFSSTRMELCGLQWWWPLINQIN